MTSRVEVTRAVHAILTAYVKAADDQRYDDVAATFCLDAVVDLGGMARLDGRDAIRAAYESLQPTIQQRRLITNIQLRSWTSDTARAVTDLVLVERGDADWHVEMVGRYEDCLRRTGTRWAFVRRNLRFVTRKRSFGSIH